MPQLSAGQWRWLVENSKKTEQKNLRSRVRTSDIQMTGYPLQSDALPTELF
jgi:hypothetical protein